MKIVFDNIVFAIQKVGGISVVWQQLLEHVQQKGLDVSYIDVDTMKSKNHFRELVSISGEDILSTICCPKCERYLPARLKMEEPFLFHSSYYRYCKNPHAINITTVHDFTYELFVKGLKQKIHTWQKFSAIRHSAAVVCISENTKKDLLKFMPNVDENSVHVIYNGVTETFHQLNEPVESVHLPFPKNSYVVFIGRRDSYKNFDLTVRSLSATSLNLVIIGSQLSGIERKAVERHLSPSRYKCLSHVSDERLNQLYNHAAALVYPSSYEGFGLPVLEAQRAGCPVIALNVSSIPEVIGQTPLLMQELTDAELHRKLQLLSDTELMKQVRAEGLVNSQRFSWKNMTDGYMSLYHKLWSALCKA